MTHREFRINGESKVVKVVEDTKGRHPDKDKETVYGSNPRYEFVLSRFPNTPTYTLDYFGAPTAQKFQPPEKVKFEPYFQHIYEYVYVSWMFNLPLRQWLSEPGFEIKEVKSEPRDGKTYVRLTYTYQHPPQVDPRFMWPDGSILLDPSQYWAITEVSARYFISPSVYGSQLMSVDYGDTVDGFPFPKQIKEGVPTGRWNV